VSAPADAPLATLRILHVVPCLGHGGLELALARLSRRLADLGAVQCVAAMTGELVIAERFSPAVRLQSLHGKPHEWALPGRLRQLIREFRPEVIHARNWGAWPDTVRARWRSNVKAPLVFSFHGTTEPAPMPWRRRLAFRVLARLSDEVFTVSEAARTRLVNEVGLSSARVGLIPNGIAVDEYQRAEVVNTRFVVGTVGNLNPIKNHTLLLRAMALLRARGVDAELRIAGEGGERKALEALARELGVEQHLRLPGLVHDVPAFLASLSAFVLCSKLEAHPNALIEAMAAGRPCVGTAVGGIPEVLRHGAVGHVVPADDANALAEALWRIAADPAAARTMALNARQHCAATYGLEAMVKAYVSLYRRLAGRTPAS